MIFWFHMVGENIKNLIRKKSNYKNTRTINHPFDLVISMDILTNTTSHVKSNSFAKLGNSDRPVHTFNIITETPLFNNALILGFGVGASRHEGKFTSDINYQSEANITYTDIDGDLYYEFLELEMVETFQSYYLDAPIYIKKYFGKESSAGLYLQTGVKIQYHIMSSISVNGIADRRGYYPNYNVVLDDIPDQRYDFGVTNHNDKINWEPTDAVRFSGFSGIGYSMPIGKKNNQRLCFGLLVQYGFNNHALPQIHYGKYYKQQFSDSFTKKLFAYGVSLSYILKK